MWEQAEVLWDKERAFTSINFYYFVNGVNKDSEKNRFKINRCLNLSLKFIYKYSTSCYVANFD